MSGQNENENEQAQQIDADSIATLVAVYNRYLVDLLLQHKGRTTFRQLLREGGHKAIDPTSKDHIAHAAKALATLRAPLADEIEPDAVLTDARSLAFEPLSGVPISAAVAVAEGETPLSEEDCRGLRTYVFVFATLAAAYSEGCEVLAKHVVDALGKAQSSDSNVDNILEDDIVLLLDKVARCSEEPPSPEGGPDIGQLDTVMKMLENSKIAGMASEISKELNISPDTDPADMISFEKLTDGNSALGKIVSKVGSTIKGKLDTGELKQEELLSEAVGFLKAFEGIAGSMGAMGSAGGSDGAGAGLLGEVMKMAGSLGGKPGGLGGMGGLGALSGLLGGALGGSGGSGRMSAADRREKLRRKLQQKRDA